MTKRLVAEFVGTFGIVVAPLLAEGAAVANGHRLELLPAALVSGLAVTIMVCFCAAASGAHFNPAVTIGLAVAGQFPWRDAAPYIGAQVLGSLAAALLTRLIALPDLGLQSHTVTLATAVGWEFVITFLLMATIFGATSLEGTPLVLVALVIGLAVVTGVLIAGPVTGASMNPARMLGPALASSASAVSQAPAYLLGPIFGATAAAALHRYLKPVTATGT